MIRRDFLNSILGFLGSVPLLGWLKPAEAEATCCCGDFDASNVTCEVESCCGVPVTILVSGEETIELWSGEATWDDERQSFLVEAQRQKVIVTDYDSDLCCYRDTMET